MKRVGEIPSFDTDREGEMKLIGRRYLLLSPFFFPEQISTGRYNTWLVRSLVQQGAQVNVVTSYPLYPLWKPTSTNDEFPNVIVHRGGLKMRYPRSTIGRRLLLEMWYGIYALYWTVKLRFRVDTVIAIIPPVSFLPIIRRVLPKHVRLIAVVHDIQGIMAMSTQGWHRKIVAAMTGWIERRALAACDKVICLSESMRKVVVQNYYVDGARCEVHYPFVTLTGSTEARNKFQDYFPQGFYHVVYAGAFGEKHQPRELVEFFVRLCRKRSDIVCHIFSAGTNFTTYQKQIEKQGLNRIKFHELVPNEQLAELYERSTVQLIPQARGTGPGAFPSKLPNLLAAGVPVFAMCDKDSELAEVILESQAGIAIDNSDLDVWVEQMEQFLRRVGQTPHAVFRSRASDYVNKKFNLDKLIAAME
jgi:glycosyltransferase involved in cell wall biosynthesis